MTSQLHMTMLLLRYGLAKMNTHTCVHVHTHRMCVSIMQCVGVMEATEWYVCLPLLSSSLLSEVESLTESEAH